MNSSKKNPSNNKSHNNNNNNNSSCFSNIFERIICSGNLPTHPCPSKEILGNTPISTKNNVISNNNDSEAIVVKSRAQALGNPGVVARLMGLDSLPDNAKSSINESLFRSKSLNSLHILPDFDPTRASFHRRARTSSTSFHEQGSSSLLCRIHENLETNGDQMKEINNVGRDKLLQKHEKIEKAEILTQNEGRRSKKISECKKRYQQERYYRGNSNNNGVTSSSMLKNNTRARAKVVSNNNKKNKYSREEKCEIHKTKKISSIVSRKSKVIIVQSEEVLQSDVMSTSPISILDHQLEFDSPLRDDAKATHTTSKSNSPKKRSPPKISKINVLNDMPRQHTHPKSTEIDDDSIRIVPNKHKLVKGEAKLAEYYVQLSGQICTLMVEDQICKDIRKYDLFKDHFIQEISRYFSREIVEFLLIELTHELVESL